MSRNAVRLILALVAAGCLCGCSKESGTTSTPAPAPRADDEEQIKAVWTAFQAAVKEKDADAIMAMLCSDNQAGAKRLAQATAEKHLSHGPTEQKELETEMGLSGTELRKLDGVGYLKTKKFRKPYEEVPESKIDKIDIKGDSATLHYTEPDNDKMKLALIREGGKWKLSLPYPKSAKP
jgi:hypothetical protein